MIASRKASRTGGSRGISPGDGHAVSTKPDVGLHVSPTPRGTAGDVHHHRCGRRPPAARSHGCSAVGVGKRPDRNGRPGGGRSPGGTPRRRHPTRGPSRLGPTRQPHHTSPSAGPRARQVPAWSSSQRAAVRNRRESAAPSWSGQRRRSVGHQSSPSHVAGQSRGSPTAAVGQVPDGGLAAALLERHPLVAATVYQPATLIPSRAPTGAPTRAVRGRPTEGPGHGVAVLA